MAFHEEFLDSPLESPIIHFSCLPLTESVRSPKENDDGLRLRTT
jgi:hypothetical protein